MGKEGREAGFYPVISFSQTKEGDEETQNDAM